MTARAIQTADSVVAALLGQTFESFTLSGVSAPTRKTHVVTAIREVAATETLPLLVSVVPRGKDRKRSGRDAWDETHTIAVVIQRKLKVVTTELIEQVDELSELVELVDDHLTDATVSLTSPAVDLAFAGSTVNPFWSVDDILERQQFVGVIESTWSITLEN